MPNFPLFCFLTLPPEVQNFIRFKIPIDSRKFQIEEPVYNIPYKSHVSRSNKSADEIKQIAANKLHFEG